MLPSGQIVRTILSSKPSLRIRISGDYTDTARQTSSMRTSKVDAPHGTWRGPDCFAALDPPESTSGAPDCTQLQHIFPSITVRWRTLATPAPALIFEFAFVR